MRAYLNSILSFIGAESLTDEEFSTITVTDQDDHVAVYDQLLLVVQARDLVSTMPQRLMAYFVAKGIAVSTPVVARSNIFVGSCL